MHILHICAKIIYFVQFYLQEYSGSKASLTVSNVTKEDSGTFVCTANNGIGESATGKANLIVKCKYMDSGNLQNRANLIVKRKYMDSVNL